MLEKRVLSSFLLVFLCLAVNFVNAQSAQRATPQQIEQLKRLPIQQQRLLAEQMGLDFAQLRAQLTGAAAGQDALAGRLGCHGCQCETECDNKNNNE